VYLAEDTSLNRKVALKFLHPGALQNDEAGDFAAAFDLMERAEPLAPADPTLARLPDSRANAGGFAMC
jgi:hypothetical protein